MNEIRFSEDYEKLPEDWDGTQARLIGLIETDSRQLNYGAPKFVEYDTKYRGKSGFYELPDDVPVLILTFIHYRTGRPFTTIRKNTEENFNYYNQRFGGRFILKKSFSGEKIQESK